MNTVIQTGLVQWGLGAQCSSDCIPCIPGTWIVCSLFNETAWFIQSYSQYCVDIIYHYRATRLAVKLSSFCVMLVVKWPMLLSDLSFSPNSITLNAKDKYAYIY